MTSIDDTIAMEDGSPTKFQYFIKSKLLNLFAQYKFRGGGGGGKMTTIFWPFGLRQGVMVKWSKIFDHDHGQNFKIAVVKLNGQIKWSKLVIFDHDYGQN